MEFNTDPQLMAAVTPDSSLEPLKLLLLLEEHFEETGEIITIEELLMTKKTANTNEGTPTEDLDRKDLSELPVLNERAPNAIGILYVDSHFHAHFTDEIVRLKKANASSLYWTAMMITEFGVNPTYEDVFEDAPAVASSPDDEVYNRELHPSSYAFSGQDDRMPVSGSQYANIMRNAETIQRNTLVISILESAGYSAEHVTREEMFHELDGMQRSRDAKRKQDGDNKVVATKQRRRAAAKTVNCGV